MSKRVAEFESKWELIAGGDVRALATSSGSTANHLLVETFLQTYNYKPQDVTVFVPSTTWASSVTPWLMRGCRVVFVDINLNDFSFDYKKLDKTIVHTQSRVKVIWPTALIGFIPDVEALQSLARYHNCFLFADLCETTFGQFKGDNILSCFDMATTSFFWAHECNSIEGGMLFIKQSREKFDNATMIRNHGLVRSLDIYSKVKRSIEEKNPEIDPEFLFEKLGTNYRMTDLNAFWGLLDIERIDDYIKHRTDIWKYFNYNLPRGYSNFNLDIVPFCLPLLLFKAGGKYDITIVKNILRMNGWETRPIISFLPINPAFRHLAGKDNYPNSKYLHQNGFYVGLNNNLTERDIDKLIRLL